MQKHFLFLAAIPLSIDHKPDRSDERRRIEDAGGFILWAGKIRSTLYLHLGACFGDFFFCFHL